jgi:hypothetical protein
MQRTDRHFCQQHKNGGWRQVTSQRSKIKNRHSSIVNQVAEEAAAGKTPRSMARSRTWWKWETWRVRRRRGLCRDKFLDRGVEVDRHSRNCGVANLYVGGGFGTKCRGFRGFGPVHPFPGYRNGVYRSVRGIPADRNGVYSPEVRQSVRRNGVYRTEEGQPGWGNGAYRSVRAESGGQPLTERRYSVGYVQPTFCRNDGQNVHATQRST